MPYELWHGQTPDVSHLREGDVLPMCMCRRISFLLLTHTWKCASLLAIQMGARARSSVTPLPNIQSFLNMLTLMNVIMTWLLGGLPMCLVRPLTLLTTQVVSLMTLMTRGNGTWGLVKRPIDLGGSIDYYKGCPQVPWVQAEQ